MRKTVIAALIAVLIFSTNASAIVVVAPSEFNIIDGQIVSGTVTKLAATDQDPMRLQTNETSDSVDFRSRPVRDIGLTPLNWTPIGCSSSAHNVCLRDSGQYEDRYLRCHLNFGCADSYEKDAISGFESITSIRIQIIARLEQIGTALIAFVFADEGPPGVCKTFSIEVGDGTSNSTMYHTYEYLWDDNCINSAPPYDGWTELAWDSIVFSMQECTGGGGCNVGGGTNFVRITDLLLLITVDTTEHSFDSTIVFENINRDRAESYRIACWGGTVTSTFPWSITIWNNLVFQWENVTNLVSVCGTGLNDTSQEISSWLPYVNSSREVVFRLCIRFVTTCVDSIGSSVNVTLYFDRFTLAMSDPVGGGTDPIGAVGLLISCGVLTLFMLPVAIATITIFRRIKAGVPE